MTRVRIGVPVLAYGGVIRVEHHVASFLDHEWCIRNDIEYVKIPINTQPVDRARCIAIKLARKYLCNYLWFVDADTWWEPRNSALEHVYGVMQEHGATAVCAAVPLRTGEAVNVEPALVGEVYEAEKAGTAMCLIDLHRLEALAPGRLDWFRYVTGEDGITTVAGEDVYFCQEVRRLGGSVWVDFQIPTRHYNGFPIKLESLLRPMAN